MSTQVQSGTAAKRTFWAVAAFYLLIGFEFFYMASPFAGYFYAIYGPGLQIASSNPALAWLSSVFLPHIVVETSSTLLDLRNFIGAALAAGGFLAFCLGAGQVYYHKLARKGAVTGGIYNFVRHPQYAALVVCSFGLLLLWPRFVVLLSFVAMLFAYYFLARVEENECRQKFGPAYREYQDRTNMFLPFRLPLVDKLPGLPAAPVRYLVIVALYLLISAAAVGLALGLRNWSLDNICGLYTEDAAYVSVSQLEESQLEQIVAIARADPAVQATLAESGTGTKFLNYVLPAEWYVSEVPMNRVEGVPSGHYHPAGYNRSLYRVVFSRAELRTDLPVQGRDILLANPLRIPLGEAVVDLAQRRVIQTLAPGETIRYTNIPVPVY